MPDNKDVICLAQDAQELKFCIKGLRKMWQAEPREYSFEHFIKHGVSAEWLLSTGNPYAKRLAEHAIRKNNGQ